MADRDEGIRALAEFEAARIASEEPSFEACDALRDALKRESRR